MTDRSQAASATGLPGELPPPRTQPLETAASVLPLLARRERFLAAQLLRGEQVFVAAPTRTKVDVGAWLLRGRVWVFALRTSLALLACGACGNRVLASKVPYARLRRSRYNHVTGQLALAPAEGWAFRGLRMDPLEAGWVLAQIYREE